jgi:hypothetical protein
VCVCVSTRWITSGSECSAIAADYDRRAIPTIADRRVRLDIVSDAERKLLAESLDRAIDVH